MKNVSVQFLVWSNTWTSPWAGPSNPRAGPYKAGVPWASPRKSWAGLGRKN